MAVIVGQAWLAHPSVRPPPRKARWPFSMQLLLGPVFLPGTWRQEKTWCGSRDGLQRSLPLSTKQPCFQPSPSSAQHPGAFCLSRGRGAGQLKALPGDDGVPWGRLGSARAWPLLGGGLQLWSAPGRLSGDWSSIIGQHWGQLCGALGCVGGDEGLLKALQLNMEAPSKCK